MVIVGCISAFDVCMERMIRGFDCVSARLGSQAMRRNDWSRRSGVWESSSAPVDYEVDGCCVIERHGWPQKDPARGLRLVRIFLTPIS